MNSTDPDASAKQRPRERTMRRGLVEQEILDQAVRLFAERGFAGTSFQDIADAVGLTRPALYHYVKSKEDLLGRLLSEFTEDSAARIAAVAGRTDLDSPGRLRELVVLMARRQGEHAAHFRLIIRSENDLPDELAARQADTRRSVLRTLATAIDRGVVDGSFRTVDARIAALGILGMVNWVSWWYNPQGNDDLEVISNQLADTAVAGLLDAHGKAAVEGPHAAIAAIRAQVDRLEKTLRS